MVEQETENLWVIGSIPILNRAKTITIKGLDSIIGNAHDCKSWYAGSILALVL